MSTRAMLVRVDAFPTGVPSARPMTLLLWQMSSRAIGSLCCMRGTNKLVADNALCYLPFNARAIVEHEVRKFGRAYVQSFERAEDGSWCTNNSE